MSDEDRVRAAKARIAFLRTGKIDWSRHLADWEALPEPIRDALFGLVGVRPAPLDSLDDRTRLRLYVQALKFDQWGRQARRALENTYPSAIDKG